MSGYSEHWGPETLVLEKLRMGNSYPETPGVCPDTPCDIHIISVKTH
jgi:hypothetical protein